MGKVKGEEKDALIAKVKELKQKITEAENSLKTHYPDQVAKPAKKQANNNNNNNNNKKQSNKTPTSTETKDQQPSTTTTESSSTTSTSTSTSTTESEDNSGLIIKPNSTAVKKQKQPSVYNLPPMSNPLPLEQRVALVASVGEEVIDLSQLSSMLSTNPNPVAYDGFEPSGRMHIAQGLLKKINVDKFTSSGFTYIFWIADWFALLNHKLGGDLDKSKRSENILSKSGLLPACKWTVLNFSGPLTKFKLATMNIGL